MPIIFTTFCSPIRGTPEDRQIQAMREFLALRGMDKVRVRSSYVMSENVAKAVGMKWPCTGDYWEPVTKND
jgi:hypothetical protein